MIAHIQIRDPQSDKPNRDTALYRDVARRIRDSGSDVLIDRTTGAGARFVPAVDDANRNEMPGMASPAERIAHLMELRPDICSLDIATLNFANYAFVNVPAISKS